MERHDVKQNKKLKYERVIRGWSQKKVSMSIGTSKEMVSRWETGGRTPGMYYQAKLCELFGKTAEELGFLDVLQREQYVHTNNSTHLMPHNDIQTFHPPLTTTIPQCIIETVKDQAEGQDMDKSRRKLLQEGIELTGTTLALPQVFINPDTLNRLSRALQKKYSGIDDVTLACLETITRNKRLHFVISEGFAWRDIFYEVSGHLNIITQHLEQSQPVDRYIALCNLASETALLLGDILFNAGNNDTADKYYNEALEATRETKYDVLRAVILVRKSFIQIYGDYPNKALALLEEAKLITMKNDAHDIIRSWICAVESETYAKLKDAESCFKLLDQSEMYLTRDLSGNVPFAFADRVAYAIMDPLKLLGYKGASYIELKKSAEAQKVLYKYLDLVGTMNDSSYIHHKSITLADLGMTYVQQAAVKDACTCAIQALDCVLQTGSTRVFQRITRLRNELEPWKYSPYVKNLNEHFFASLSLLQRIGL